MPPKLDFLIRQFRAAQDHAVNTLVHDLGIPIPESNLSWPIYCGANGLYQKRRINGIDFHSHGYGVELKFPDLTIDFDWGKNGEPDGFDAWRLYNFSRDNCPDDEFSHLGIGQWLEDAYSDGELTKLGNLYFDPRHRA